MARPLRQVARDHDRVGPQVGKHLLEALDLIEVGEAAEVEVREVEQLDGHDTAWTVEVSVASPFAGTEIRNRTSVAEGVSAGTLLSVARATPNRASRTSTATRAGRA